MHASLEKLISPIKYFSGSYLRDWRRRAVEHGITVVVCYHRIVAPNCGASDDFAAEAGVSVDVFARHMEFLARNFRSIPPSEASIPAPGQLRCAVTFDDGYLDNYTLAAPVLKRFGLTAGFFVCSDFVDTERWFWWEAIAQALRKTRHTRFEAQRVFPEAVAEGRLDSAYLLEGQATRERACKDLLAWLGRCPQGQIDAALGRLVEALDIRPSASPRRTPLMDWFHLRELRRQGFEIGAHTANHVNLAHADPECLLSEMAVAHQRLEAESDGPIKSFAYPYGGREHLSQSAYEMAGRLGYPSAFTTVRGIADGRHDPLLTPRIHLNPPWFFGCAYNVDDAFRRDRAAGFAIAG